MWQLSSGVIQETKFPFFHLTTTSVSGDIKDKKCWRDLCHKFSLDKAAAVNAEQVHDNKIAVVDKSHAGKQIKGVDGLITREEGLPLAVFTADCLPIFFGARNKKAVGIIHGGWRGIAAGIINETLNAFEGLGIGPRDLMVAIGPHIQKCCYGVGKELREAFHMDRKDANLDLAGEVANQLRERGTDYIIHNFQCTAHEKELFFSYRRDKTKKRMLSMIKL